MYFYSMGFFKVLMTRQSFISKKIINFTEVKLYINLYKKYLGWQKTNLILNLHGNRICCDASIYNDYKI